MLSSLIAAVFTGMFLINCIAHVAAGLLGMPFPTPFAKPHGVGLSSPMVNLLWGMVNLVVGLALLAAHPQQIGFNAGYIALLLGALALGLSMARHFGKVRAGLLPKPGH